MAESRPEASVPADQDQDTFPKLLLRNARDRGAQPAMREKDLGIWQAWTWSEVEREVRALACGLAALGFRRGDKIAIIGDNRPRLYWTMVAAQCLGGVPVPMYQDAVAEEMAYVLDHAEARFALAEDQEQVDKLLEIRERCPRLETVVYDDSRGLRHYKQDFLSAYDDVLAQGREHDRANPEFLAGEVGKGQGADISIILYTSGTTGQPKGVVLSFENVIRTAQNAIDFDRLSDKEEMLAYLPMAWVGDHIFSYGQSYCAGFCVSCPESSATVMHDLNELGPTFFFAPPRIFENILTTVMIRMADAGWIKRNMFHAFMAVARRVGTRILDRQPVSAADRLLYALGEVLVYGPLKNRLGLSRVHVAYTAGEAIGPDIFDFYRSLGINLKQLYGMTEASVFVTLQPDGEIRADTVGRPAPDVEIRLAEDGEVLFRSPGVFQEYFKNPEATAEAKTPEGWVHTGDAGLFTEEGHLRIIDRAKDVGRLSGGSLFAPKYLENKLKFFPEVKEVVTFGHERDYVTAFINIDLEAVGSWAERNNVPYASYQELAANEQVYETIKVHVEQVNQDLAADPQLAGTQIRRFLILHKELDPDDGELTRTRKVRRRIIADRYEPLIDALYGGADHAFIETQVTFEDGRTGRLSADLRIVEAKTYPAMKMAS
ncbi:MAG: AMP-binding protein [Kiloniellales bacterium]|nr:AMP-binding protein [Kiloniellales bacterium]